MHASMMGYAAVKTIVEGRKNKAIVYRNGKYVDVDIDEALTGGSKIDPFLYEMFKALSI
jgi:6-phosphofructokinase 1